MKLLALFPNAIVSWQEPASYAYGNSKNRWLGLVFAVVVSGAMVLNRHIPFWVILASLPFMALIGLFPWLHARWPSFFPLTGPLVTLYDDRIACQSGKSQTYITLDNIAECRISIRSYKDGSYTILSFTPKNGGLGGKIFRPLTETAITDTGIKDQVAAYLRDKGVPVKI